TDHYFEMTAFDEMGIAGHLMMRFLDEEKKELRFGFIIVDGEKRGKGYGKEMLKLAIGYAFETLKTERITIGVFENNESARRCYESVGFRATGRVEMYSILGEKWTCRELELGRE
ncbi:MAG: GNAT family N-acetyltransferase, partial [Lachnospiraceae bacterium]|nr:GNAT family N-acetyltransferase [Lachnospiraceae bacterium]